MIRALLAALMILWAATVAAQTSDADRDFITGLIEDAVSNDDFIVRLENFEGALSSEATADAITLADADGVWLRLDDLTITWDRSALLSGQVEIENLGAKRIELIRLPVTSDTPDLATAEATPFTLPDLPVSVDIAAVSADEIILTEALLGEPVTARFEGSLTLANGAGATDILLERTDTKEGLFDVTAAYVNETRQLTLSLLAAEGENGIAARLLSIPDRPSVRLQIDGDAPLDNFTSQIALATDDTDRITGTVRLSRPAGTLDQAFALDLSGDLRPMLADQYDPFFGTNTVFKVEGTQFGLGGLRLSTLTIAADQIVLRGAATFDAKGWPTVLDLRGRLGTGNATRVLLPLPGTPTEVSGMSLNLTFDAAAGDAWTGAFDITSLTRDGIAIDALALSGGGTLIPGEGDVRGGFSAGLAYAARGLAFDDAALSQALGSDIEGDIRVSRTEDGPLRISDLTLAGAGLTARAFAVIQGPDDRFETSIDMGLRADDFARFSAISTLDLGGTGAIQATGNIRPFDGIFDLALTAQTNDLSVGIDAADPLLAGETTLSLNADRDTTGTRIRQLTLTGDAINATGSATLTGQSAIANFTASLTDLGLVAPSLSGPGTLRADVQTDAAGVITLDTSLSAPRATGALQGTASPIENGYVVRGDGDLNVTDLGAYSALIGQRLGGGLGLEFDGTYTTTTGVLAADVTARTTDLRTPSAALDPVLAGLGRISANVSLSEARRLRLDALDVVFPNVTAQGAVATTGTDTTASFAVRLRDVALLTSDFSGPLTADLTARQDPAGWQLTGTAEGPVGTSARATGRVSNSGTLDLNVTGDAPLALANVYISPRQISGLATFDLTVNGPPALSSVRGPVRITDARLAAPNLQQSLENLRGTILLAGGTARLDLRGDSTAGGDLTLTGPVDLAPPFQAGLTVSLNNIVLRDPTLYRTEIRGDIAVTGPLAGGAAITGTLALDGAEVQVPSTGVSALGTLPDVTHLGARSEVINTLTRAGVGATPDTNRPANSGPAYPLDLTIRAPSRIFVRGRGLDAELGGQLRLTGTTNDIIPIGRFDLVRGRLDILGQRFDLDEGFAQLQGDFIPFLRLVATTDTRTGTTVSIIVEGPADAIDVRFESSPELPQDEVLAQLLFGRDLSSISPLQAVQLASAVATLAGTGGGGVLNNIREGLDLDDFDITTDEDGNAAVRAGKYISENVYTDVTIGADGTSEINLNLEIDRNFTARGSVASDGETSVGIFFERDY